MEPLLALAGLALVDSLNSSALAVALLLLTQERPAAKITAYMAGVFVTYLSIAVLLMLGIGTLFTRLNDALFSPTAYGVQAAVGAALFIYSWVADPKKRPRPLERVSGAMGGAALFLLAAAVTVMELSTALPLLGAVGLLTYLQWPVYRWLPAWDGPNRRGIWVA